MNELLSRGLGIPKERVPEYYLDNIRWNAELWKALRDFIVGYCRVMFSYVEHRWLEDTNASTKINPGWPCRERDHEERHVQTAEDEVVELCLGALVRGQQRFPAKIEKLVVMTARNRATWKENRGWGGGVMVHAGDIRYESDFDPVEVMQDMTESVFGAYAWSVMFYCCQSQSQSPQKGAWPKVNETDPRYTLGKRHLVEVVGDYVLELWPRERPWWQRRARSGF